MKVWRILLSLALVLVVPAVASAQTVCQGIYATSTHYGTGAVCSTAQNNARSAAQAAPWAENSCPGPYYQPCDIQVWVSNCWLANGTCNAEAVGYYGCIECVGPQCWA